MKIRGEKGSLPSMGGRSSGGITGAGGAKVNPVYKTTSPKSPLNPKVKLSPEPSSVTIKQNPKELFPGSAAAANKAMRAREIAQESAVSSKSGLKAANKTPRLSKSAKETKAEAQRISAERAKAALAANKAGKGPKLTAAQKLAFRKNLPNM